MCVRQAVLGICLSVLGLARGALLRGLQTVNETSSASSGAVPSASACYEAGLPPSFNKDAFPFCEVVEPNVFVLYWNHDVQNYMVDEKSTITFGVVAKAASHDWVALGINVEGNGMHGTDIIMHRKDPETGSYVLEDRFATTNARPELDESQDKTLMLSEVRAEQGLNIFSFSMPVNGICRDERDVSLIAHKWAWVMWAMGKNGEDGQPMYHGTDKGSSQLDLLTTPEKAAENSKPIDLPADVRVLDLRLPFEFAVPKERTTYMCYAVEMPQDATYHAYALSVVNSSHPLVHHLSVVTMDLSPYPVGQAVDCTDNIALNHGAILVASTRSAVSDKSMHSLADANAAWPLGKGYTRYWVLEAHFFNPDGKEGEVVSPGFKAFYSPTLRKYDAGFMILGAAPSFPRLNMTSPLAIPPKTERYDYIDYCSSACTKKLLHPEGINVLQVMLHSHTLTTSMEVQVLRNNSGKWDRYQLADRSYYDFANQQLQVYNAPGFKILPGDRMITRCTYNSMTRDNTTWWGEGSDTEMCTALVLYYPAYDHSLFCVDVREARHPILDTLRKQRNGVPLPLQTCTTGQVVENLTAEANPQPTDLLKIVITMPDDELHVKDSWQMPQKQFAQCDASASATSPSQSHQWWP